MSPHSRQSCMKFVPAVWLESVRVDEMGGQWTDQQWSSCVGE